MKKFLISLFVLIFVVSFMCIYMRNTRRDASNVQKSIMTYDDSDYKFDYKVITIDGREYIATKTQSHKELDESKFFDALAKEFDVSIATGYNIWYMQSSVHGLNWK